MTTDTRVSAEKTTAFDRHVSIAHHCSHSEHSTLANDLTVRFSSCTVVRVEASATSFSGAY